MDEEMSVGIEEELVADLTLELSETDPIYNENLMLSKIRTAIREVKQKRNYPDSYTSEMIEKDLYNYYTNIRAIAVYDYNLIGVEEQASASENGTSATYISRNSLFSGVVPLIRVV